MGYKKRVEMIRLHGLDFMAWATVRPKGCTVVLIGRTFVFKRFRHRERTSEITYSKDE